MHMFLHCPKGLKGRKSVYGKHRWWMIETMMGGIKEVGEQERENHVVQSDSLPESLPSLPLSELALSSIVCCGSGDLSSMA